jgi:hypothetical protein
VMLKTMIACYCRTRPEMDRTNQLDTDTKRLLPVGAIPQGLGRLSRAPLGTPPLRHLESDLDHTKWSLRVVFIASSAWLSKDCHLGQSRLRPLSSKVTSEVASTSFQCDGRLFVPDAVVIPGWFRGRSASCRMRLLTPRHKKLIRVPPMAFEESSSSNGRAGL